MEPDLSNASNFSVDVIDKWAEDAQLKAMIWTSAAEPKGTRKDFTFKHFSDRSHRVAKWMSGLGVRKGDRMMIMLPRVPEWWEILLGALRLGVVVIPCTILLTPKDIEYRLRVSQTKLFVSDEAGAEKFSQISNEAKDVRTKVVVRLEENAQGEFGGWSDYHLSLQTGTRYGDRFQGESAGGNDPAIIYFTSPKLVYLINHEAHTITGRDWFRLSVGKVYWNTSELGWGKAAWAMFGGWAMGATLFIQDDRGAFNAERLIRTLHEFEITTLCAAPTIYRQLVVRERLDMIRQNKPRALECCLAAGEALNAQVLDAWKDATGLDIYEGYGQTETVLLCGNFKGSPVRSGSMGKASPAVYLAVIDETGKELPADTEGNIAVRLTTSQMSPCVSGIFDGYLKEDDTLFRPEVVEPETGLRWFSTGDRATRDNDGYFWFVGRADDVINTAGYRVGPFELESVIKEHEGVIESAVVASPDPGRGEIVKAFIVLTDEYRRMEPAGLARDIQDFVARSTAPYKKPREIEFVDLLPKTISGKVRHVELRARERVKKARLLHNGAKL